MLGNYRVERSLGRGGMGEVYRARDRKLGRDVALKVLPTIFTADPERLARFQREARMLATLNYPNIGAIYGFEEAGGIHALEVYVAPFRRSGATYEISTDGGQLPQWGRDGTEMFFLDAANRLVAASIDGRRSDFKVNALRTLFQTRAKPGVYALQVSPSGDRFLINTVSEQSTTASFTVVVNWPAGVKNRD